MLEDTEALFGVLEDELRVVTGPLLKSRPISIAQDLGA